jgi:aminopeptidase N
MWDSEPAVESLAPFRREKMRRALASLALAACPLAAAAQVFPGHRLPEGPERPVRERAFHTKSYRAELSFDMAAERIAGTATVTFEALRAPLSTLSLDAADLEVTKVERDGKPQKFTVDPVAFKLDVALDPPVGIGETAAVAITYSCRPRAGMYFFPRDDKLAPQAWNYGEGGLHRGWLPIYADTNDRFSVEFVVTVPKGLTAVANGRLEGPPRENADGTRTFRWVQEGPIPNYLVTVDVGELVRVPLRDARVGQRTVPLSVWTPPGTEEAAKFAFGNTPDMVEYFSTKMSYPYPWFKYDQVVLREFAGAMETTTATGFSESELRRVGDPPDLAPDYEDVWPVFTYEDVVAHELAHHWFGDLVTCRSLGSIWLNESFATFWHTMWNGRAHGEEDLTYQRWVYLNKYVDYVRSTGSVRPMEYLRYKEPSAPYQEETTYVKGSLVLHMIRHFLGDADFDRMIAAYLKKHEYGSVDSADLKEAIEGAAGRNLSWFFEDWVVGGGGHPRFEVSYRFVPERKQVDLTVKQIQADLPFENEFRLPVEIEIADATGAKTHRVELSGWQTSVALPADRRPLRVTFDRGGWLVCEVKYARPISEVLAELSGADLAGKLRAARQLADDFPTDPRSVEALSRVLADPAAHWGLKQEAALDLGRIGSSAAVPTVSKALGDADARVRRAAALGLGQAGEASAADALRRTVETDRAEDVVAAAEISLGRLRAPGVKEYLIRQLARGSRWWDSARLGALLGLSKLADPSLAPVFELYTGPKYVQEVRLAALNGWEGAAPEDPKLAASLRTLTSDRNRSVRLAAIQKLGKLHHEENLPLLESLTKDPDPNVAQFAKDGIDETKGFVGSGAGPGASR